MTKAKRSNKYIIRMRRVVLNVVISSRPTAVPVYTKYTRVYVVSELIFGIIRVARWRMRRIKQHDFCTRDRSGRTQKPR